QNFNGPSVVAQFELSLTRRRHPERPSGSEGSGVKHLRGSIKRGRYARLILRVRLASDPLSFFVSWPLISLATTRESKLVFLSVEPAYLELRVGRAQKFSAEAQGLPAAAKRRDRYSSPRDLTWNGKPAPSTQTYLHKQLDVAPV